MTTRRIRRPLTMASALILAGLAVLAPVSASAEGDDDLDQTIDPNQTQGTGQVVLDQGHVDFGPTLSTGEWIVQIHDDTARPSYWRHLDDVVLKVADAAILPIPDAEAYRFLGQEPGTEVWVVPQTQNPDVVWAGWNTQEPNVIESLNLGTTLSVLGMEGPGDVVVYLQSGNFGDPQPLWSSLEPFPQQSWIEVNQHTHANWVFSEPGIYLVELQFDAELNTGESVSARDTLRFVVGDATDAEEAFGMEFDQSVIAETAAPDPSDDTAGPAADRDQDGDGTFATLIWSVVGVVAVVLVIAIIVVVTASRRAKARALAARNVKEPTE
ncbi:hypothetical protein FM104_15705 [Microbacterium esteraromaticum]|uniref:Surface-anchored protein n=1 Tax=Microbacterium esteraromaticum TaxID=57043 RepID=A0A1R4KRY6_9MICO|nr:choice-of-anchor M domain-containing protein [Microbacterium esteraromaticum]SJN47101.1 hypothetical protein FM104_15705 [Microbacterium esteraromaticum]